MLQNDGSELDCTFTTPEVRFADWENLHKASPGLRAQLALHHDDSAQKAPPQKSADPSSISLDLSWSSFLDVLCLRCAEKSVTDTHQADALDDLASCWEPATTTTTSWKKLLI